MNQVKITKLCNIEIGKTPSRNDLSYWGTGINWVSIRDMKGKYIFDTKEEITLKAITETGIKLVPENTVIMSFKLSVGKVAIVGKDMYTNEAIAAFHIIDDSKLYFNYLYYVLQTLRLSDNTDRAVMGLTLNKHKLKQLSIPLPPLETQKKIVEVLDKAQGLIDARKDQIRLMDELIQSVFYEMFGDPVTNPKKINQVPLGELCNLKAGKFIKAAQISDLYEKKLYPCYGGNGLRGYVEEYTHDGSYPLIGRQGALCGNVQFAEGKFYATEHAIVTQPIVDLDIIWLYIMLREMNLNRLATGAAQPGLNVSTLTPLEVIYPAINLQVQFANKFKEIEIQKTFMQKSLVDIENNYYGLMQKAFNGKLF